MSSVSNRTVTGSDGLVSDVVVLGDKDGNPGGNAAPSGPTNSTTKSVASSTASTNLLAANTSRKRYSVFNESTAIMYLLENGGAASATNYSTQVAAQGYYVTTEWRGTVNAAWATANGNARVTEYTP